MKKQVWKYPVELEDVAFQHEIPSGSTFLSCQRQRDKFVMWWLVDPKAPGNTKTFRVFGTGHEIHHNRHHRPELQFVFLATFQTDVGEAYHLFEER